MVTFEAMNAGKISRLNAEYRHVMDDQPTVEERNRLHWFRWEKTGNYYLDAQNAIVFHDTAAQQFVAPPAVQFDDSDPLDT